MSKEVGGSEEWYKEEYGHIVGGVHRRVGFKPSGHYNAGRVIGEHVGRVIGENGGECIIMLINDQIYF